MVVGVGKGTHRAADKVQEYLRKSEDDNYFLQLDIRKFFYRIDRDILTRQIENKIKDKRLMDVIKLFIVYPDRVGIPIGNLLSQVFALIYLNPVDHYIKRVLKIKMYVRYVDDFVLFNLSKEQSRICKELIEKFIRAELNLELSKFNISKTSNGINFVGYRAKKSFRLIRKHSLYKFNKKLKQGNINSMNSILSHALHTSSFDTLCNKVINKNPRLAINITLVYRRILNVLFPLNYKENKCLSLDINESLLENFLTQQH
jgi:hypothetical protein